MSFWDDINPVKAITKAVNAVVNVVKKAVDAIKTIVETAVSVLAKIAAAIANGFVEFVRNVLEAAKWVMDVVADVFGLGKDGWLTEFLTKNIPFAGILAAAVHGLRGNKHHAEYAAAEGLATGVEGLAAAAGSLGGPLGGMLGGAIGAAARHGIEAGLRGELDPSVRDKIAPFSLETMLTDMAIGAAFGAAGGKSRLNKVKGKRNVFKHVEKGARGVGLDGVANWARKRGAREALNETAIRAAQRAGRKGASRASKDIAKRLGKDAGTTLTIKNLGKKVVTSIPKDVAKGLGREATGRSRIRRGAPPPPAPPPSAAVPTPKPKHKEPGWTPKPTPVRWAILVLIVIVGPAVTILVLLFTPSDGSGSVTVTVALPPRIVQAAAPPTDLGALPPRQTTGGDPADGADGDSGGTTDTTGDGDTTGDTTDPSDEPTTTTAPPATATQPATTPSTPAAPPAVRDWTLLLTSGAPEGYQDEPILLRFGIDPQQVTTGTVYDPLLEDTMTTFGEVGAQDGGLVTELQSDGASEETGTLYLAGHVNDALDRIDGFYALYFVVDGEEYYYEGDFIMTRRS